MILFYETTDKFTLIKVFELPLLTTYLILYEGTP